MHSGTGRSPCAATFGCEPRVGLASTTLPPEVAAVLRTEEDLQSRLGVPTTSSTTFCLACAAPVVDGDRCLCEAPSRAVKERQAARERQAAQADRMLKRSHRRMSEICVGDNVRVGIPDVDRSRVEQRNLICVVLKVSQGGLSPPPPHLKKRSVWCDILLELQFFLT